MLARRPTQPKNRWQAKPFASTCTLLITLLFSHASFAAEARADYDLDDDGLIEINDLADLNEIRNNLDGKTLYGSSAGCPNAQDGTVNGGCIGFELTTDLDFDTNQDGVIDSNDDYWNAAQGWLSLGNNYSSPFNAVFEGNGFEVRNLYINRPNNSYIGLFGYAQQAEISNVVLTGPLTSITGSSYTGGLVGYLIDNSIIKNSLNTGSVQGQDNTGGLAGYIGSNSTIKNSLNTGSVQGEDRTGGLVGYLFNNSTIENAISTGSVQGQDFIGGLVGSDHYNNTIESAISIGWVAGVSNTGGLMGAYGYNSVISNSYWATDTSGQTTSAGQSDAGITLANLQCPTAASNTSCVPGDVTLFNQWDQALDNDAPLWHFGETTQLPALVINGNTYRDSDGDGVLDGDDTWPNEYAAGIDADGDLAPDRWTPGCDEACIVALGLQLDQFPNSEAAWEDDDLDGKPDSWNPLCVSNCGADSGLVLDTQLGDTDNDGIANINDTDDNDDGITDADANSNGLIDIHSLAQLDAIRHQLDGGGLRLTADGTLDQSGCPAVVYQGQRVPRCHGYELTTNLDFDTNQDGVMDSNDDYWNAAQGWSPLGSYDYYDSSLSFNAVFEGNGFEIRNLYINRPSDGYIGLFGYADQAEFSNVVLTGPLTSITGNGNTGSLVGRLYLSEIRNSANSGAVYGSVDYTGGLVGSGYTSIIKNSLNTGLVQGSGNSTGGLAGGLSQSTIKNSINTGSVKGSSRHAGGLAGRAKQTTIENSLNTGPVQGQDVIGGLVGYLEKNSTIVNAMSTGWVAGASNSGGGLVGVHLHSSIVTNSYWATDSSGRATSAGQSDTHHYAGFTLANLQCPTAASNTSCMPGDVSLFNQWDQALDNDAPLWHFGETTQLPALVLNGNTYRDSDGDGALDGDDPMSYDSDNDGIENPQDVFPFISIGELADVDNDGAPDTCDSACIELGMTADTDDDNDGLLDTNDRFPLVPIGELTDTDNDGAPDTCDQACLTLGMTADTDDDNDGLPDTNDRFPLVSIGELTDTDNDGAPNTCDTECLELGMFADADNDNDGVLDINDAYPLISLGSLSDTDGDGIPNNCNTACLELDMLADTDDDNDGVVDVNDAYTLIAIGDLLDTDNDGAPNACDIDCLALGMSADLDDDNDGVLDVNDAFPLIAIGDLLDTDNDGAPDTCDANCLALNMAADLDDDNDGVLDTADAFPLDNTEHSDFDNDGIGDVADLDDDNDGVNDVDDPNLGEDNGKPEIRYVPSIEPVAVTTENGDAFELLVDDNFLNDFTTVDAVDTEFTYEASLNGNVLAIDENDIMLIPAGRQAVQVVAIDAAGNRSEPVEMVAIVYPQVRFEQATSIIGENSTTNIKVSLTGDAPDYPVVINFAINEQSDVNQADLDAGFDITAQHQLMIEASDTEVANRDGFIEIDIIDDNESENDELLFIDLLSAKLESETDDEIESLFVIDETNMQHKLTVTYQNLAPVVNLKLEQNGVEVANVQQDAGMVSITAIVQDGNGNDVHTLTWDLNNLGLNAPLGNTLNFSPASLPVSTYEISVIATDNGVGQLSDDAVIRFDVVAPPEEPVDGDSKETEEPKSSGGSGGGAVSLWLMLLLFALVGGVSVRRANTFSLRGY